MRKAYVLEFRFNEKRAKRNRSKLFSLPRNSKNSKLLSNITFKTEVFY